MTEALLIVTAVLLALLLGAAVVVALRVGQLNASVPADLQARLGDLEKGVDRVAGEVGRGEAAIRGTVERTRNEDREALKSLRLELTSSVGMLVEGLRTSFGDLATAQKERLVALEAALNQATANAAADARSLREDVRATLAQFGETMIRAIDQLGGMQRERLDAIAAGMARLSSGSEQRQDALRRDVESALGALRTDASTHARALADDVAGRLKLLADGVSQSVQHVSEAQRERLDGFARALDGLSQGLESKHEALRRAVDERLASIRDEQAATLEQLRLAIAGEIQSARDLRLIDSMKRVSETLDQAHKAIGEMQSIAGGAGNLRVLPRSLD